MPAILSSTALSMAHSQIQAAAGSPYYLLGCQIHCGGQVVIPIKVSDLEIGQDFTQDFADATHLTVELALGDAIHKVAPFVEDLRITCSYVGLGDGLSKRAGVGMRRTYTAYIATELPSPSDIGGLPHLRTVEMANLHGFITVVFRLEEVAVGQFKRMSYGLDFENTVPIDAVMMLLEHSKTKLKLPVDQTFKGIDLTPADNTTPRVNIVIEDGTSLMDIPDHIQNNEGGIYNAGLGFYLLTDYIYIWPLYSTRRQQESTRMLRAYIAPDGLRSMSDRTWREEGRRLDIWCGNGVAAKDTYTEQANVLGTGIRYVDTRTLLNGFAEVGDDKIVLKRGKNTNEYSAGESVKGEQFITNAPYHSSNTFLAASRLAKRQGKIFTLTWTNSDISKIKPNMSVEVVYDRNGKSRKIKAALLGTLTKITTEGKMQNAISATSNTALTLFVDRNDPNFEDWVASGAVGASTPPKIE